jgi:tetratricopeptide (TPR) repeat protein
LTIKSFLGLLAKSQRGEAVSKSATSHHFNDRRLRDLSLRLFTRSLRNERMVALVGAMGTEALGYYSWDGLAEEVSAAALKVVEQTTLWFAKTGVPIDRQNQLMLERIESEARRLATKKARAGITDTRVTFGILSEGFRQIRLPYLARELRLALTNFSDEDEVFDAAVSFRRRIAQLFLTRRTHKGATPAAIKPLLESLGINRFATLNYDFELERALMLRWDERKNLTDGVEPRDKLLVNRPAEEARTILSMIGSTGSGRRITQEEPSTCLSRVMGDGLTVKSDIVDRERPDRLLEFAIGSSEVNRHILHLHGRADEPDSMIFDIGDYDERYRRDDLFRNPFEHGMRVLFAGNPILFVGLGMTEPEINDKLQYFVSNTPYRRMAPAFLVWNTLSAKVDDPSDEVAIAQWMADKRIDFLTRLGVYIIFDRDLVDRDKLDELEWRRPRSGPYDGHAFAGEDAPLRGLVDNYNRSAKKLKNLGEKRTQAQKQGDLREAEKIDAKIEVVESEQRQTQLKALAATLEALPRIVAYTEAFSNRQGEKTWRTAALVDRLKAGRTPTQPVRMWGSPNLREAADGGKALPRNQTDKAHPRFPAIMLGISGSGVGRGVFGEQIAQVKRIPNGLMPGWNFHDTQRGDRLLINAGFSYDSDSMLSAIAIFLQDRLSNGFDFENETFFREEAFVRGKLFKSKALIIINGIDRFFNFDGDPLSAEVDHLMRCIIRHDHEKSQVQWLLLGTPRVARYFAALRIQAHNLDSAIRRARPPLSKPQLEVLPVGDQDLDEESEDNEVGEVEDADSLTSSQSRFLSWIAHNCCNVGVNGKTATLTDAGLAKLKHAKEIDTEAVRRAFFAGFLSPLLIRALDIDCPVAFEILRTMAFIGIPMEGEVLLRTPAVRAMLEERCGMQTADRVRQDKACRAHLEETIAHLASIALIIEIRPEIPKEDEALWVRYGLHRSVAAEMRERHGAPISDAKLSTTFNMSLFVAQPEDRYTPRRDFHEELGTLVDRLTGAWKDVGGTEFTLITADMLDQWKDGWLTRPHGTKGDRYVDFVKLAHRSSAACIRVALAVVRGYYSTANLLTFDRLAYGKHASGEGALTEHANRIDRILRTFGHISMARQNYRELVERLDESDEEKAKLIRNLGDEPWYPDDLVWLHNERAVCKLVQGHLYGARRSLTLAEATNRRVEGETRGHNWRRIRMNMVALLIERGRLRRAQRVLDEIEWTIDEAPWARIGSEESPLNGERRTDQIRDRFGAADKDLTDMLTVDFSREEIMMTGLTTAYRGLVAHMRGDYRNAEARYHSGIAILRRLGELRAYSIFQRHYAALLSVLGSRAERIREISLAVVAADAIQQSDVAHRARVLRASAVRNDPNRSDENRRAALEDLREALEQASISDSFRVRVEAGAALAREMRLNGDYETALRYASDALAIACRYGHSLQKIWLRVEIGQILIRRGDPKSGEAMLDCAERSAVRTGYKRTIERIHRARSQDSLDGTSATREPARIY